MSTRFVLPVIEKKLLVKNQPVANEIDDRYIKFLKEWNEAAGGNFEGVQVNLIYILNDVHFLIYGFYLPDWKTIFPSRNM